MTPVLAVKRLSDGTFELRNRVIEQGEDEETLEELIDTREERGRVRVDGQLKTLRVIAAFCSSTYPHYYVRDEDIHPRHEVEYHGQVPTGSQEG